ncbi:MAG: PEP-CTERM system TPR-repeat protein PrsT [Azoarcus sp.]|jgi:putative PEP-CTERM system TPR-repeat lipoprotein|nr:PEP-CTERM system TPR-repeat protein PrsT [Azoarcus sp.]
MSATSAPLIRPRASGHLRKTVAALFSALLFAACSDSPEKMVTEARRYINGNDYPSAIVQLKNALQKNDRLAEGRFLLGWIYFVQEDYTGAVKELRQAFELGYPPDDVVPYLVRALVYEREFAEVVRDYASITLRAPDMQALLEVARGDALAAQRKYGEARQAYAAALAANPRETLARVGQARLRLIEGDVPGAQADAAALAARAPALPEAHILLADILLAQGKTREAEAPLAAAARARPNSLNTHAALTMVLLDNNNFEAAKVALAAMKRLSPEHPAVHYAEAYLAFRAERLDEARTLAMDVARVAPGFLPGQLLAGMVLVRRNENALAQTYLGKVLEATPNQPLARTLMVASLLGSGQVDRARDTLQPLLGRGNRLTPEQLRLACQIYIASEDLAHAEDYCRRASEAAPNDPRAKTQVGIVNMMAGNTERAMAELEQASRLDPNAVQADLAKVAIHMRRREIDKAFAAFAVIERKKPNEPQTYNLKGGLLIERGDRSGARAAYEKALALRPDFLAAIINLARIDLAEQKPEQALRRFEKLIGPDSKNADAMLAYADVLNLAGGRAADIQRMLERAVSAAPEQLAPNLALARFHMMQNDPPRARAAAQQAVVSSPDDPRALEVLGQTQMANRDYQQAASTLGKLASLLPRSLQPLLMLANAQHAAGDVAAAEATLKKALALKPDDPQTQRLVIASLLAKKDTAGALKVARAMQRQTGNAVLGYSLEGDIQTASGKHAEAIAAYRQASRLGGHSEQFVRLHAALLRDNQNDEAEKLAGTWLKTQPKDLAGRTYLAERAITTGRHAEALRLYRELIGMAPGNALLFNNMAWVASQVKDSQALAYAERARELAPDNPAVLDTLGTIQIERGQTRQGLANIERAVGLAQDIPALRLSLAKAYARLGRRGDARREAETVSTRVPAGTPLHNDASTLLKML